MEDAVRGPETSARARLLRCIQLETVVRALKFLGLCGEDLPSLRDGLKNGERLEDRFTVRTVTLSLEPRTYSPTQVKAVRHKLRTSQAVFAKILAVTPKTLQGWEQGKPAPKIARRLLDL